MSSDLGGKPKSEQQGENSDMPKSEINKDTDIKENVNSDNPAIMPDSDVEKSKVLPEPIRAGKDMPRLPPINMAELTSILQGPDMPSQKLMKEVTEKIRMKNDESGSDDGSVSSGGGVGIKGILDCILEVSLFHQDSEDESDGDDDEIFVRELPCKFCKKIFGSTMNLKTHVLMTHSQEDPSVLNVRNQSRDGNRKEKLSPGLRSRSTEGREKESLLRGRKRTSVCQPDNAVKEETTLKEIQQVRSRHNSKDQSSKEGDKTEDKACDLPSASQARAAESSLGLDVSSQTAVRQSSQEGDAKKCDLKPSVGLALEEVIHSQPQDTSSSSVKATKRKSPRVTNSASDNLSSAKKAKRSRNQSGEAKESRNIPQRRSSRKK